MLVALAAASGAGLYYYNHVNDEIRQRILDKLANHYAGLKVEVRSALLIDGEGIEIRGVTISDPDLSGPAAELAYFDEIVLTCGTELSEFLHGEPKVAHVRVRRPRIRATRLPDGRWSAARLFPCPKFGKHRIETVVENGIIELTDATRLHSPTFTLREVNLELHPLIDEHTNGDDPIRFNGSCAGDYFQRIDLAGRIEAACAELNVEGKVERLDISPEFRDALPGQLAESLAPLAALRATCGLDFAVLYKPGQGEPGQDGAFKFRVDGQLSRGRYDDPRLPQALTELVADFHADQRGVFINRLTGKFGQSSVRCFGHVLGFAAGSPMFVDLKVDQLLVGRNWEPLLSREMREHWQKFQPAGEVNAHVVLSYDGRQWRPDVEIDCTNVSFTYHKFLYRVDRGRGNVTLKEDHLSLNLIAQAGGREISIKGEIDHPGPQFTGAVEVAGDDLAIDSRIIDALAPKSREIACSLNPTGTFSFFTQVRRDDPSDGPHQFLKMDVKHCSVRYDKFPYPIGNIHGAVQMKDGQWWSDDLEGTNDTGRIFCKLRFQPSAEGPELTLHFGGKDIVLEEELRDALPPKAQRVWNDMRPRGSVDLTAQVRYVAGTKKPDIQVWIQQFDERSSIEPVQFPYRMEKLRGGGQQSMFFFDSRTSRVDFANLRAFHGRTSLAATGYCTFDEQGRWLMHFERLTADGLRADGDLVAALPPGLKKIVVQLNPSGLINLDGMLDFAGSGAPQQPLQTAWNLDLNVQQSSLNAGVLLENVNGGLHLEGQHDGRQLHSKGELAIDSLTFKDFQFTELRGPLSIDDKQVIFGTQAERPQPNRPPRKMSAKLYGGAALADLWIGLGQPPRYVLQVTLTDGDLERFAREHLAGKQQLKGKVGVGLALGGTGASVHEMEGRGQVRLREADIYELPLMVQLLALLSIRLPDKTGFTKSDVEFDIAGEHIDLKNIEFSGDAISLVGKGEMNLNSDIRATLSAIVGRSEWQLPVFKTVMGQASEQFMQIHVDGNLADPHIHREAFPGINQALQQLQAGVQPRAQPAPIPQAPSQAALPVGGRR